MLSHMVNGVEVLDSSMDYDSNDDVWHIIDPSDPTPAGFWRIPFNSSISANLSAYSFFKHGGVSSMDLQSGNFEFTHPLENGSVTGTSGITLLNKHGITCTNKLIKKMVWHSFLWTDP